MESRTLDITLQYAKDLNKVNLISKMDVYAVVTISGGDKNAKQKTKTPVDQDGDANPTWNFPMKFTVDEAALQMNRLSLDFKLVCQRALGDKDVGEVHVPIKELLDSKPGADGKQVVSYQVRKPSGKPKGQLNFSYQFGEKTVGAAATAPYGYAAHSGKADSEPVTAYPAGTSAGYPPPGSYPPPAAYPGQGSGTHAPPQVAYAAQGSGNYAPPTGYPPAGSAPKPGPEGYPPPPPAGYGYPPPPPGYGYPPPPPPGYGYPPQPGYGYPPPQAAVQPPKKNKFGMGLGAGLLGGALGGLLIGDMVSDAADYDCGGFDGGFDF